VDGIDGEFLVAGCDGRDDVGLASLHSALSIVAPMEAVIRRYDLELDAFGREVLNHRCPDDVVADVVRKLGDHVWEPRIVLVVELGVFCDVVGVGGAGWHTDDVDHFVPRDYCKEDAVALIYRA